MKPYKRADRVAGHVHKALSSLLQKGIKEPSLDGVTITGVRMSPDLRQAKIYYTVFSHDADRESIREGFSRARGHIKRILAKHLGLKYMPDIHFFYDESLDRGARIEELLKSIGTDNEPDYQQPEEV